MQTLLKKLFTQVSKVQVRWPEQKPSELASFRLVAVGCYYIESDNDFLMLSDRKLYPLYSLRPTIMCLCTFVVVVVLSRSGKKVDSEFF